MIDTAVTRTKHAPAGAFAAAQQRADALVAVTTTSNSGRGG